MSSAGNPYATADERQRAARCDTEGWALSSFAPLVAGAVLSALLWRAGVYAFVGGTPAALAVGSAGLALRVGLVLAIVLAIGTYDTVVRGPDRGVIDVHPLLGSAYLRARLARVARERAVWLGVGIVVGAPLWARPTAAIGYLVVVAGAWAAGIGLGLGVNLLAPRVAAAPAAAGVLDAIRGSNPREQAPFLYAPGVAVGLTGLCVVAAQVGLERLLAGGAPWLLGVPWVGAALGTAAAFRQAGDLARLPAVLGEIDARWAGAEVEEDARRVYLEWMADRAPPWLREELRKELRHGWRGHRTWVLGAWALGALCAVLVTTEGADRLRLVGVGAVAIVGLLGDRLRRTDPPFLDLYYPRPHRHLARVVAMLGWSLPVLILGGGMAAWDGAWGAAAWLVGFGILVAGAAALLPLRWYTPLVLVVVALGVL